MPAHGPGHRSWSKGKGGAKQWEANEVIDKELISVGYFSSPRQSRASSVGELTQCVQPLGFRSQLANPELGDREPLIQLPWAAVPSSAEQVL